MSNFSIFNPEHLQKLLDPFGPGMSRYITPIKYEALTPDLFLFLFRTTAPDHTEHFFVALEFDYVEGLKKTKELIQDWHGGKVLEFLQPVGKEPTVKPDFNNLRVKTGGPYYAMLAKVERPIGEGYWASSVLIMPDDKIGERIAYFSSEQQAAIRKGLKDILKHRGDPAASIADSFVQSTQGTIVDDVNKTDIAVSIYITKDGQPDFFYNYVTPTIGGKLIKNNKLP